MITLPDDLRKRIDEKKEDYFYIHLKTLSDVCTFTFNGMNALLDVRARKEFLSESISDEDSAELLRSWETWHKAMADLKAYQTLHNLQD